MQNFAHPVPERPDDYWNLDVVLSCRDYIEDVEGIDMRKLMERYFKRYEKNILPKIKQLRKAVIHGDLNEQNILVQKNNPEEIAGIIDFGDLQYATHINDLAIALAYTLLNVQDIEESAREIIIGYHKELAIQDGELEVLIDLVAMRLISSIILTSHRARAFPENSYILVSQEPARKLLKKLETLEFNLPFGKNERDNINAD